MQPQAEVCNSDNSKSKIQQLQKKRTSVKNKQWSPQPDSGNSFSIKTPIFQLPHGEDARS